MTALPFAFHGKSGCMTGFRVVLLGSVIAFLVFAPWQPDRQAWAQQTNATAILSRDVEVLRSEVQALQARLFRSSAEGGEKEGTTQILIRLQEIESLLKSLTGEIENVNFRLDRFEKRLEEVVSKRGQGQSAAGGRIEIRPGTRVPSTIPGFIGSVVTSPENPLPGTVGDPLGQRDAAGPVPQGSQASPEAKYRQALELLRRQSPKARARAELVLREFLATVPANDKLAPQAEFWLGEVLYQRRDFVAAVKSFKNVYTRDPDGVKAPESLAKLAISLGRMRNLEDACTTFSEFARRYPNPPGGLRALVTAERNAIGCEGGRLP